MTHTSLACTGDMKFISTVFDPTFGTSSDSLEMTTQYTCIINDRICQTVSESIVQTWEQRPHLMSELKVRCSRFITTGYTSNRGNTPCPKRVYQLSDTS